MKKLLPSLARAADPNELVPIGGGTGFSITEEGHLLTNHHAIEGCSRVQVKLKGNEQWATVLASDSRGDLALLKASFRPRHVFSLSGKDAGLTNTI